jgi:hypothetical protein
MIRVRLRSRRIALLVLSAGLALAQCKRRDPTSARRIAGLEEGAVLHDVACGTSRSVRGSSADKQQPGSLAAVAATFPQRADAERMFAAWARHVPADATLSLSGPSILVTLPRTEVQELARLKEGVSKRTGDVLSVREAWQMRIDLTCRPADARAATAVDDELAAQLGAAGSATLVPAWATRDSYEGPRLDYTIARHTYGLWFHHALLAEAPPDQVQAVIRRVSARPPGTEESDRRVIRDEISALEDEAAAKEVARIRQGAWGPIDGEALDLLAPLRSRWPGPATPLGRKLAERMGVVGPDDSAALAASVTGGSYGIEEGELRVFGLSFRRPDIGLPAFIDWLCAARCTDVRYRLTVLDE